MTDYWTYIASKSQTAYNAGCISTSYKTRKISMDSSVLHQRVLLLRLMFFIALIGALMFPCTQWLPNEWYSTSERGVLYDSNMCSDVFIYSGVPQRVVLLSMEYYMLLILSHGSETVNVIHNSAHLRSRARFGSGPVPWTASKVLPFRK